MKNIITHYLNELEPIIQEARHTATKALSKLPVQSRLNDSVGLSEVWVKLLENDLERLTNKSYRLGKQQAWDMIAELPPVTEPDKVGQEINSKDLNKRRAAWLTDVQQTSGSLVAAIKSWGNVQQANGRSVNNIKESITNDLNTVSKESHLPSGRVTGSYMRKYVTDFEAVVSDANIAGQREGYTNEG